MKKLPSPYGEIQIAPTVSLFEVFVRSIQKCIRERSYPPGVALTGGSTPKRFYEWLAENPDIFPEAKDQVVFTVSDERYVPIDDEASNFGNAQRLFLDPFAIPGNHRLPWDTSRTPADAARWYEQLWSLSFGEGRAYDICMLGMGDDAHTASLFPGSPLLEAESASEHLFEAVKVPGKGERLTITPKGLSICDEIAVFVTGSAKAETVKQVFERDPDFTPKEMPVRLFKHFPEKVKWYLDEEAGALL